MTRKVILTRPLREAYVMKKDSGGERGGPPSPSIEGRRGPNSPPVGAPDLDNYQQALDLVEKLTGSDLKKLYDHLALRLATVEAPQRDLSMWATAVYDALTASNGGSGAGLPGPLAVKQLLGARSCWSYVESFARSLGAEELRPAERLSLYRLLANLLVLRCVDVARHARIPLSAKLVANNCSDIASVFESAFPGYVGSGLVGVLVKRLLAGGSHD